ncbi:MAG: nucleotidyl transferase AbiEii/AbiGii toxin family protein [Porphyromonadaceae bacterium]|nr:nucleotidyl transferase AbiEii/AbiGii toxin family protein [Porphyromonadaceae bacterium]
MVIKSAIQQWREHAPWTDVSQIEQDLIISRTLVTIFRDEFLASRLAFRGGTALHKLYLQPQARYSEDIDLVQITAGPIKPILFRLGELLSFLPDRVTKQKRYNNTMLCRIQSEGTPPVQLRLKIEINCFEHFTEMGLMKFPFSMENQWFSGACEITTFRLAELLGTKLRALYQRKKGRDLLDLYLALTQTDVDTDDIIRCYKRYIGFVVAQPPTYRQFVLNMEEKMQDPNFLTDSLLLLRPGITFDPHDAYTLIKSRLIDKLMNQH